MKDSAWYRKLWRKKFAELPLKEDAGAAWAGMKNMLDAQMPVNSSNSTSGKHIAAKSLVTKTVALLVYVLPAAAMIGTAVYFTVPVLTTQKHLQLKKKQTKHLLIDTLSKNRLALAQTDSLNSKNSDSTKNDSLLKPGITGEMATNKKTARQTIDSKTSYRGKVNLWTTDSQITTGGTVTHIGSNQALTAQRSPLLQRDNVIQPQLISGKPGSVINKSPKISTQKSKTKNSSPSKEMTTPLFDYGIEAGFNKGNNNGIYIGAFGTYRLKTHWLLNAGIRVTSESVKGSYISPATYFFPDSLQPFKVTDKRKLLILNIPLTLEYRISNTISLNLGPVVSFPVKQSDINYQLGPLLNQRDTISSKSLSVDTILKRTTMNKINIGFTGGVSFRLKQFYLDVRYQQNLTPYKVSSDLGSYQQYNRSLQLGIRYKLKQ